MKRTDIPGEFLTPANIRRRCLGTIALGMCLAAPALRAAQLELRVLIGDQPTPAARETLAGVTARFPAAVHDSDVQRLTSRAGGAVYTALGVEALQALLDVDMDSPVLSLLASSEAYRACLLSRPERRRGSATALFAEASPGQQLALVRLIYRRRVTAGVLLTENTAHLADAIKAAARSAELDLEFCRLESGENPIRALGRLASATVLLAVPDRAVISAENVQAFLEATYRRGMAVVGFSAALVRAGALASVYSTVDEVVAQATLLVEQLLSGQLPVMQFPAYWRVAVNDRVARSLNIPIDHEARSYASPTR